MAKLSTHVLDTHSGYPAAGMTLRLERWVDDHWNVVLETVTNADGRTDAPLLQGDTLLTGRYRLTFGVGDYFRARGVPVARPAFLDQIPLEFGVAEPAGNYHVPLLCSPWSYSTYRGS